MNPREQQLLKRISNVAVSEGYKTSSTGPFVSLANLALKCDLVFPSEKVRLQEDILLKQELIKTRKGEIKGLQEESSTSMKQREELEREKGQYLAKLDQLDTQVRGRRGRRGRNEKQLGQ